MISEKNINKTNIKWFTLDFFYKQLVYKQLYSFYKMIKQLQYWQIFGNSTDKQLIAFLSMNKKIIACTKKTI